MNDIEKENRKKIHIDLQQVWQMIDKNKNREGDVSSLIDNAKKVGYEKISCSGGFTLGQFYNCYVSKYHYVEINYDGKVYKCTARDYKEPYEMQDDGSIVWNEVRLSKLYASPTFDNPTCLKCAYLPLCWGPCPQKIIEIKKEGIAGYCVMRDIERSVRDRLIDMYESSLNLIKQNVVE